MTALLQTETEKEHLIGILLRPFPWIRLFLAGCFPAEPASASPDITRYEMDLKNASAHHNERTAKNNVTFIPKIRRLSL
jgi:hypothetical protein